MPWAGIVRADGPAETAEFDTLTAEAQRAIDLQQERRPAHPSAAVMGQMDVRGVLSQKLDCGESSEPTALPSMTPDPFIQPRFVGLRFEGHALPLSAVKDLINSVIATEAG